MMALVEIGAPELRLQRDRMRYVSIALWLMASTAGAAANWQQIATLDGSTLLMDAASIVEVKGFRRAWFKSIYPSDQAIPKQYQSAALSAQAYRWVESMSYFNCTEKTTAVAELRWYSAEDKGIGNLHLEMLAFRRIEPGSADDPVLDTVCKAPAAEAPKPFQELAKMKRPVSPADFYPEASRRRGEQGKPVVEVCVGPSGKLLRKPVVTESTGFPDLDAAAIKVATATRYSPGTRGGSPLPESCMKFKIVFGPGP
jgi:TonB family protein